MRLSELAHWLNGQHVGTDPMFNSVSLDSRVLEKGALFVAIKGDQFDGHAFIEQAQQHGAVAALVEQAVPSSDLPYVQVADTRRALGILAHRHRQQFTIPVIALTGSCGKTTTKEMLRVILQHSGPVLASIKSFNNDIGVPLTLLNLNSSHRFAVIELGANHLGEIATLSQMVQPTLALITNIAPAHLQGFGSIENVAEAKSELFLGLPPTGVAFFEKTATFAGMWRKKLTEHRIVEFGLHHAPFSVEHLQLDEHGCAHFHCVTPQGTIAIHLALPGQHNVLNALAAAAVATELGIPLTQIKRGLETMADVPGRLARQKSRQGACIIDDTYNANPGSVQAALQFLAACSGKRIFVFGEMAELGEHAARYHQQVGDLAKKLGIEALYTCGELTALTAETFGGGAQHYATQEALLTALQPQLQADTTVLVKGSRRAQMDKIVSALLA